MPPQAKADEYSAPGIVATMLRRSWPRPAFATTVVVPVSFILDRHCSGPCAAVGDLGENGLPGCWPAETDWFIEAVNFAPALWMGVGVVVCGAQYGISSWGPRMVVSPRAMPITIKMVAGRLGMAGLAVEAASAGPHHCWANLSYR